MKYRYDSVIQRIVDGDTVDVHIDLGFGVWLKNQRVRLMGIDAPDIRTRDLQEKAHGAYAMDCVSSLLPVGSVRTLISREFKGKYGRILGDFAVFDSVTDSELMLTAVLLREHAAVEWSQDSQQMTEKQLANRRLLMEQQWFQKYQHQVQ